MAAIFDGPEQGHFRDTDEAPLPFTPDELLRIHEEQDNRYWHSLALTMPGSSLPPQHMNGYALATAVPFEARVRMSTAYTSSRRAEVIVPQEPFQGPTSRDVCPDDVIYFNTTQGPTHITLAQALCGEVDNLVEKDLPALPRGVSSKISIRIQFKHCQGVYHRQVMALRSTSSAEPIPRGKLAETIAKETRTYLSQQGVDIEIDGRTFFFDQVFLRSLRRVSKGSWQPEFYVFPS